LPSLSEDAQRAEMSESRRTVEEIAGGMVNRFAYPFGDFDERSERLARELGFAFALATEPGAARSSRDLYRLPRYAVGDWGAEQFAGELATFC
jgi:peptidoglycan/xylan/chitin deacetylase (PgdA/CDA1 family)